MINLLWTGLLGLLLLSGCGYDGTATRNNDFATLTSIEINAVSPTIAAGSSTDKLSVNGIFSDQATRDITGQAVWSSDTPAVANFITAASPNRVTGIAPGTATLTATVGSLSATFRLTVSSAKITTMTISPAAPSIVKNSTTQFAVSGTFSDNTTQDLTFDAAWASSAPAVATVSDTAGSKGLVKTLLAGTSTISATFDGVSGTTQLIVTEPVLQSITVTPANPSLLSLSTSIWSFQATGHYSDGSTADITGQAAWASSINGIATIATTGGAATALSKGTTSISATLSGVPGISGATDLNVTGGNLLSLIVSPAAPTLVSGTIARMTVIGSFDNNSSRDITGVVAWSPADATLATVTKAGGNLAWLNANGVTPSGIPTEVTASVTTPLGTFTNATNPTKLTVTAPTLQSIAISPTSSNLASNTSTRFIATATFSDNSTQDVTYSATWSSDNSAIASVGDSGLAKGRVSGVAAGSATIGAAYGSLPAVTVPVAVAAATTLPTSGISVSGGIAQGTQVRYIATAANGQVVTEDTTWSIDDPNVAILADSTNQPGQVVGVFKGSTTLRATFGGNTSTTSVTVQ